MIRYGEGPPHRTFLDNEAFASEKASVFKLCLSPLVPWGQRWRGEISVLGATGDLSLSSVHALAA